ncbi:MAG: PIG-L deacetylase family protein, partial [Bryobacteraceae bacterium]
GYEACFLAGLRKIETGAPAHRPRNILYASLYAAVSPSFVVDISDQFERRMEALFAYRSQYGLRDEGTDLFPSAEEIRERLAALARFYGNLIGTRYGEPFVVRETLRLDDIVALASPTF